VPQGREHAPCKAASEPGTLTNPPTSCRFSLRWTPRICRLAGKDFLTDPVVKGRYSRITSIVSSAYKRHGAIIEKAFVAALKESPHLSVWAEPDFRVSAAAERLADADATASSSTLSYLESAYERVLQVDLLVFDSRNKRLGSYECKRGFGYHDSGKKRSMLRDLRCVEMLLKSYGEGRGLDVNRAEARIVFYYGTCSLGSPWTLIREVVPLKSPFKSRSKSFSISVLPSTRVPVGVTKLPSGVQNAPQLLASCSFQHFWSSVFTSS